jgi:hypothetical protein
MSYIPGMPAPVRGASAAQTEGFVKGARSRFPGVGEDDAAELERFLANEARRRSVHLIEAALSRPLIGTRKD